MIHHYLTKYYDEDKAKGVESPMKLYVVMKSRGYIKPNSDTWSGSQKHSIVH